MKVILLQDIENIGEKFQIKNLADGYVRNFLIPKGLVKLASEENLKWLEVQKNTLAYKAEAELKSTQEIVSKMDGLEMVIKAKAGKQDKIFGSITSGKIAELLVEKGFDIKKSQIQLENSIKQAGEWPVKINFLHGLEAEIKIIVEQIQEQIKEKQE